MAAFSAARRTSTAYERMRAHTKAWDVLVNPGLGSQSRLTTAALRTVPGIADIGRVNGLQAYFSFANTVAEAESFPPTLAADTDATYRFSRPAMVAGRQPAAEDPNGVWVSRAFANQEHLSVGESFNVLYLTAEVMSQSPRPGESTIDAPGRLAAEGGIRVRVDGIGVLPDGVVSDPGYESLSVMFTPAFLAAHPTQIPDWGAVVRLRPGVEPAKFVGGQALVPGETIVFQRGSRRLPRSATRLVPPWWRSRCSGHCPRYSESWSWVRPRRAACRSMPATTRRSRRSEPPGRNAWVSRPPGLASAVVVGTVLAVVTAVLASPLGPVGSVRSIEVHPGIALDWPVLVLGSLAILVCGLALCAIPAYRWAKAGTDLVPPRRSRVAVSSLPEADRWQPWSGSGSVSNREQDVPRSRWRTTLLAAGTAVALVTAVVVFSASLDHLVATPRLFGSPWRAQMRSTPSTPPTRVRTPRSQRRRRSPDGSPGPGWSRRLPSCASVRSVRERSRSRPSGSPPSGPP